MKTFNSNLRLHAFYTAIPLALSMLFSGSAALAQSKAVIDAIVQEETTNSQLQPMAHELFDGIGPRLVGSPQMKMANDWAVAKYKSWGISAKNEKWGEWRGWERGVSHIDMISPRIHNWPGAPVWAIKLLLPLSLYFQT